MSGIDVLRAGRMEYLAALELQERLLGERASGNVGDTLVLVEHPPVLTLGRRGDPANILLNRESLAALGVGVHEVNRGGDVTYHGPGQVVGYPVMDLRPREGDAKGFVHDVEEVFIRLLDREFGIPARREEGKFTGVWVGDEKIVAIGIAVRNLVTMHGFAFNVNVDLSHFGWINPCGITDRGVTSLKKLLGRTVDFEMANRMVASYFVEVFEQRMGA